MTKIKRDQEKAEEFHEAVNSDIYKQSIQEALGAGITQWLERRIRSSPGRSGGRIFFSRVNFLC